MEAAALAAVIAAINGAIGMALALVAAGVPTLVIRPRLVSALRAVPVDVEARVRARWAQGVELGAAHGLTDITGHTVPTSSPAARDIASRTAPADVGTDGLLQRLNRDLRIGLNRAVSFAEHLRLDTSADVAVVQAKAAQGVSQARSALSWVANRAVNAGTEAVARESDAHLVWVNELDACDVCLALAGHVTRPGETFDVAATYGKALPAFPIANPAPLTGPPRHPNCRCKLRAFRGDLADSTNLSAAIKRAALRNAAQAWPMVNDLPPHTPAIEVLLARAKAMGLPPAVLRRIRSDAIWSRY